MVETAGLEPDKKCLLMRSVALEVGFGVGSSNKKEPGKKNPEKIPALRPLVVEG